LSELWALRNTEGKAVAVYNTTGSAPEAPAATTLEDSLTVFRLCFLPTMRKIGAGIE